MKCLFSRLKSLFSMPESLFSTLKFPWNQHFSVQGLGWWRPNESQERRHGETPAGHLSCDSCEWLDDPCRHNKKTWIHGDFMWLWWDMDSYGVYVHISPVFTNCRNYRFSLQVQDEAKVEEVRPDLTMCWFWGFVCGRWMQGCPAQDFHYSWSIHHVFSIYSLYIQRTFVIYSSHIHLISIYFIYPDVSLPLPLSLSIYIHRISIPTPCHSPKVPWSKGFVEPFWDSFTRASCYWTRCWRRLGWKWEIYPPNGYLGQFL